MNQIVKTKYMNLLKWMYYTFEDKYKWGQLSIYNAIIAKNYEALVFAHKHDAFFDINCVWKAIASNDFKIASYVYNAWLQHPNYKKNKWITVAAQDNEKIQELVKNEFDTDDS